MSYQRALLAVGAVLLFTLPAMAVDRVVWHHHRGHFENTTGNHWVEKSPDGTFYFREVRRAANYIELYDRSRDCTVRLTPSACLVRFGGEGFREFYRGHWER